MGEKWGDSQIGWLMARARCKGQSDGSRTGQGEAQLGCKVQVRICVMGRLKKLRYMFVCPSRCMGVCVHELEG